MLDFYWIVKVVHVFREQNRVTDFMAKSSFNFEKGCWVFDRPPNAMLEFLNNDAMCTSFAKRVNAAN